MLQILDFLYKYGGGKMEQKQPIKGFMLVASFSKPYYDAAVMCADSIKDFYPGAKIAIYTHKDWFQEKHRHLFDHVHLEVPVHIKAKLWALTKTPYDITAYIDADMCCQHKDVRYMFDEIDDEHDMAMSCNRPYNSRAVYITENKVLTHYKPEDKELIKTAKTHEWDFDGKAGCWRMKWHTGMFIYKKNERTFKMLDKWYENYRTQIESNPKENWPYNWPSSLWYWDTFAFFNTNYNVDYGVKIKEIHAKWNYIKGYKAERELTKEDNIVFWHYGADFLKEIDRLDKIRKKEEVNDSDTRDTIGNFKIIK
jgi:hypothetical protein